MTTIEKPADSKEKKWASMEDLKKKAQDKERAINQPKRTDVKNHACVLWKLNWVYSGSWLSWGEAKCDNPWGGAWKFTSFDGKISIDCKWGVNGLPMSKGGTVTVDGKSYNIGTVYYNKNSLELTKITWTARASGIAKDYSFEMGSDFKLNKITYNWVSLDLVHEGWSTYIKNKSGKKLQIWTWGIDMDTAACWVTYCIAKVKNSEYRLNYYEVDYAKHLQADYADKRQDVQLITDCYKTTWIPVYSLEEWLNDNGTRKQYGI